MPPHAVFFDFSSAFNNSITVNVTSWIEPSWSKSGTLYLFESSVFWTAPGSRLGPILYAIYVQILSVRLQQLGTAYEMHSDNLKVCTEI